MKNTPEDFSRDKPGVDDETVLGPVVDVADLKRKSARGGLVTVVGQGLTIGIQLTSTVTLARLLSPTDYGIIAMVMAVANFAGVFRDLGLSSAAIQKQNLTHAQQTNLFWLNVAVGGMLTLVVSAASPLVVWFYGKPELLWVTIALSFSFLIGSFGSQHGALLVRNMQFGRNAIPGILGALAGLVVSIFLALRGWSYWALVWGNLSMAVVTTALLFVLSPFRPGWFRLRAGTLEMVKFGANVTAFDFINYFHRNLDNVLIGKFVGADALGLYSRAYALLMLPISNLRIPISSVGFPALSRLQNQPGAFREYYRKIVHMLALVSMPLTAFLFVASDEIVLLLLGVAWAGAVPIFAILALVALIQPVITLWGIVVLSRGMGRRYVQIGVFNTMSSAIGFVAGLPWGVIGVATGYAIATYVTAIPTLMWAFLGTPVRLVDFFAGVARPFIASVVAAGITSVLAVQWSHLAVAVHVAVGGGVFVTIFSATLLILPGGRHEIHVIRSVVMSLIRSRSRS
ncbi:MAG: lipopolysaccharide biosynthesis protein [Chthoniobacterales bacterium]|nr:lipopolysaccharide biosynthesis protein [Chthoniobacterales bacterium]